MRCCFREVAFQSFARCLQPSDVGCEIVVIAVRSPSVVFLVEVVAFAFFPTFCLPALSALATASPKKTTGCQRKTWHLHLEIGRAASVPSCLQYTFLCVRTHELMPRCCIKSWALRVALRM